MTGSPSKINLYFSARLLLSRCASRGSDKLLAEVIRSILNAYFDGTFSEHSHGFRPERGCHTALREIYHTWKGTTWIIEGDIADCFGSLNHELIVSALSEHIQDGRFLNLIKKVLDAGYMEDWKFNRTLSGVPQGSILSPVLSNILLSKLDRFVETKLLPQYNKGRKRKANQTYRSLINRAHRLRQQGQKEAAQKIKQRLRAFLREELKLELSEEKTLVTHTRDSAATFLGYEITTRQSNTKQTLDRNGYRGRSINGDIGLKVPTKVIREKCKRYMRKGKPFHRAELLNESDYTILATYQLEYRGIVNYYRLADNLCTLQKLKGVMEQSLTKTLAAKHKISVRKVYQKYHADLESDGKTYKGLQVTVSREGKKPLVAAWGGISLTWDINAPIDDLLKPYQWNKSELEKRLLAQVCEQCGATRATDQIEVHVRRFGGRDRAHQTVRELMEGSLYTPLTLPSKEEGDQSMWGRPCREKSLIF